MNLLSVKNVNKTIKGSIILEDVTADFEGGKIYAVVGDNGAGKTMLYRVLTGLAHKTSGEILYNTSVLEKGNANIGLLMDDMSLYPAYTGFKNLKLLACIRRKVTESEIKEAITRVGLDPSDQRKFGKYSLGMKQRLMLAQAIMEKPDFLLLDEPTNGVDKDGVELFYDIIRQEAERGAVVIITSHIDSAIKTLADEVYIMRSGRLYKNEI